MYGINITGMTHLKVDDCCFEDHKSSFRTLQTELQGLIAHRQHTAKREGNTQQTMHKMQLKLWQWTIQLSGHSMIETNWRTMRVWEWGVREGKAFNYTCRGTIRQPLFLNGMPWFANNYDAERNLSTSCSLSCKAQLTNFKIRSYVHPSLEDSQAHSYDKTTMELSRLNSVPLMACPRVEGGKLLHWRKPQWRSRYVYWWQQFIVTNYREADLFLGKQDTRSAG